MPTNFSRLRSAVLQSDAKVNQGAETGRRRSWSSNQSAMSGVAGFGRLATALSLACTIWLGPTGELSAEQAAASPQVAVETPAAAAPAAAVDHIAKLQTEAILQGSSPAAYWGTDPNKYAGWNSHSNRLIPVYTFGSKNAGRGVDLNDYQGANSPYRDEAALRRIYGYLPVATLSPEATYLDQTNLFDMQKAALDSGKKHIFLVIFDGMDWQTSQAAAIYNRRQVAYREGRGTGLHFQDYRAGGNTQFGYMVTSPYVDEMEVNVDTQTLSSVVQQQRGGYDARRGGAHPWSTPSDPPYLVGQPKADPLSHAYTDSSSSASSMTAGIKTYNAAVNIASDGSQATTIAHLAQAAGYGVGAVSSVPIPHATPAATYAHNVHRDDYQDLTRDMIGRPSISHPQEPLPGLDVVVGTGWGAPVDAERHARKQGRNYVPGNPYVTADDLQAIDRRHGGKYVVVQREAGRHGARAIAEAATTAAAEGARLFGFFGVPDVAENHLPYQSANGDYRPAVGVKGHREVYTPADIDENPTLAEMTAAAITVLQTRGKFWLMVEPGDVDWANHKNNLDASIGAVNSGDAAVRAITQWVEQHSNWDESLLIVTADHGHYLVLTQPEALLPPRVEEGR